MFLPSASAAASVWVETTAQSISTPANDWTFYRFGGEWFQVGLQTIEETEVLRLTATSQDMTGLVVNSATYDPSAGLDVRFTIAQWGTETGADGMAFVLADAGATLASGGATGGSLAYSGAGWDGTNFATAGLVGGLLGIGFDNFGNFGTSGNGPIAGGVTETSPDGFSAHPYLAIRSRAADNFELVAAVDRDSDYWAASSFSGGSTRVRVTVTSGGQVTVSVGSTATAFTSLTQVTQVTVANLFDGVTSVRYGFSAATGGQVNNHAVYEDVSVTTFS